VRPTVNWRMRRWDLIIACQKLFFNVQWSTLQKKIEMRFLFSLVRTLVFFSLHFLFLDFLSANKHKLKAQQMADSSAAVTRPRGTAASPSDDASSSASTPTASAQRPRPDMRTVSRKTIEEQVYKENTNHVLGNDDAVGSGAPVDLDLMIYQIKRKNDRKGQVIELLIFLPFIVFATMYMFFGSNVSGAYWIHYGVRVR